MFMPEPIGSSIGMSGCIREQSNYVGSVARTCRAICLRSDILRKRGRICCHHLFVGNYLRSPLLFEPNLCRERARKRSQNPFLDTLKTFTTGVFIAASLGTIGSLSWSIAVIVRWNVAADSPGPVLVYVSSGSLIVHLMTIILLLCCHYVITYDLSPCVAER
jgi:hypothetical protein